MKEIIGSYPDLTVFSFENSANTFLKVCSYQYGTTGFINLATGSYFPISDIELYGWERPYIVAENLDTFYMQIFMNAALS